jgi:hypothetical protein
MRLKIIGILLLLPLFSHGQAPETLKNYQTTLTRVAADYQTGDRFLAGAKLDSALAAYLRARSGVNDLFFILINAKKQDSLSAELVTRQWDWVLAKMQVKIDSLADCEFDRCLIYREEKAANWCIHRLKNGKLDQQEQLLGQLIALMNQDAKSQLKNFFSKIQCWIELELTWLWFQKLQAPEKSPASPIEAIYHQFREVYAQYRNQIS